MSPEDEAGFRWRLASEIEEMSQLRLVATNEVLQWVSLLQQNDSLRADAVLVELLLSAGPRIDDGNGYILHLPTYKGDNLVDVVASLDGCHRERGLDWLRRRMLGIRQPEEGFLRLSPPVLSFLRRFAGIAEPGKDEL